MEVPVFCQINGYGHKKYGFHQMLPSNETKESLVPLITYWPSPNKTRFTFKYFLTPEEQTCVYTLRASKLTNVTLEHQKGKTKQIQAFPLERSGKSPKQYDAIFLS